MGASGGLIIAFVVVVWAAYFIPLALRRYDEAIHDDSIETSGVLSRVIARATPATPEIAVGDGALGFWKALDEVFPGARHQRCRVHKVANVLSSRSPWRRR